MNKKILFGFALAFLVVFMISLGSAEDVLLSPASTQATVCCEKTTSGLYCQDVPQDQCAANSRAVPTSCASTSYCKGGTCYDSGEGTCLDNTPQIVCNSNNGTWSEKKPDACNLGCCILGDQSAFVSLVRCKRLSGFLGLQTNYRSDISDEVSCVLASQGQEKGACVFVSDFEKTCKFTTRADCTGTTSGNVSGNTFYNGKLCSAEELGTNCGPTSQTTCVAGKDGIYFVDSCGNPANIYDASKLNDKAYWANVVDITQSCNGGASNANSAGCGNCNYAQGSICRDSTVVGQKASYGNYICADLNCKNTDNGKSYKHGESWCVYTDSGTTGKGKDSVGSRFYKHVCVNGEEIVEQCDDFRQKVCIEGQIIMASGGTFSQAACRVNRWQDCTAQLDKTDCENGDKRDCLWVSGSKLANQQTGTAGGNSSLGTGAPVGGKIIAGDASKVSDRKGACVPQNPPGLNFWDSTDAPATCSQANAACVVTYEKGLVGGEKCSDNCDCLTDSWASGKMGICTAMGDCGTNVNWLGKAGSKKGYQVILGSQEDVSSSGGGLFG